MSTTGGALFTPTVTKRYRRRCVVAYTVKILEVGSTRPTTAKTGSGYCRSSMKPELTHLVMPPGSFSHFHSCATRGSRSIAAQTAPEPGHSTVKDRMEPPCAGSLAVWMKLGADCCMAYKPGDESVLPVEAHRRHAPDGVCSIVSPYGSAKPIVLAAMREKFAPRSTTRSPAS